MNRKESAQLMWIAGFHHDDFTIAWCSVRGLGQQAARTAYAKGKDAWIRETEQCPCGYCSRARRTADTPVPTAKCNRCNRVTRLSSPGRNYCSDCYWAMYT